MRIVIATALCVGLLAVAASTAAADSTPVGPLPKGPLTSISAPIDSYVAVALPRQKASTGLVWRIARAFDARIVRQTTEGDVGATVVVVFRTLKAGTTTIRFALTRGDTSAKAVRAASYRIVVRTPAVG